MIALDLDNTFFHRPTAAASLLEFLSQHLQVLVGQGEAAHQAHPFSLASLGLPAHPNNTIAVRRSSLFFAAPAGGPWGTAVWTMSTGSCGVYCWCLAFFHLFPMSVTFVGAINDAIVAI